MRVTRLVLSLSAALLFAAGLSAQAKPEFSGTWTIVTPTPGAPPTMIITQDATSVGEAMGDKEGSPVVTIKLDGTESRMTTPMQNREMVMVSTAAWRGNSLVMKTTAMVAGASTEILRIWTLDAENQLNVEVTTAVDTPQARTVKAVYKRK